MIRLPCIERGMAGYKGARARAGRCVRGFGTCALGRAAWSCSTTIRTSPATTSAVSPVPRSFVPIISTHTAGSSTKALRAPVSSAPATRPDVDLFARSESRPGWMRQPMSCTRSPPIPKLSGRHLKGPTQGSR